MLILFIFWVCNVDEVIQVVVWVEYGFLYIFICYFKNIDVLYWMVCVVNISFYIKNGFLYVGLGFGGEGWMSWMIVGLIGEGLMIIWDFI